MPFTHSLSLGWLRRRRRGEWEKKAMQIYNIKKITLKHYPLSMSQRSFESHRTALALYWSNSTRSSLFSCHQFLRCFFWTFKMCALIESSWRDIREKKGGDAASRKLISFFLADFPMFELFLSSSPRRTNLSSRENWLFIRSIFIRWQENNSELLD